MRSRNFKPTVTIQDRGGKRYVVHIETPLGVINIWTGLTNDKGEAVESISMRPNQMVGEPKVRLSNGRFIESKKAVYRGQA